MKEVLTKADRFSIDFPPDIGKLMQTFFSNLINFLFPDLGMKATLLGVTFLIDYLHFEADPTDEDNDETP